MKNKIFRASFALVIIFGVFNFISCSKDEVATNPLILGTWKLTEVKMRESGSYITWPFQTTYASFKSDGTYSGSGYFGNGSGTWTEQNNTIYCYVNGVLYASYEILSVTSTNAELKMTMQTSSIWIKCKKQ